MTVEHDSFPTPGPNDQSFHVTDWEGCRLLVSDVYRCNSDAKDVCAFVQAVNCDGVTAATTDLTVEEARRLAYILNHCANEREEQLERDAR